MKLKSEELIIRLKEYFKEKADTYKINMAFLFGSYARGYPKEESDIDIALYFSPEMESDQELFNFTTNISVDLMKKIKAEINVIPIYKDFRKPMLYYNAVILGIPLYVRDSSEYALLFNQAIFQMEDFELFGTRFQREAAKNLLKEVSHG